MTGVFACHVAHQQFRLFKKFLLSTPGLWLFGEWYPLPLPTDATGFLMKDFFLLGAALWSAGEALRAARRRATSDLPQSLQALHGARKTGR